MSGNNVFDGLFSSPERDIATSHRNTENHGSLAAAN